MILNEYLLANDFVEDPFASTNADTEELLKEYFVPPPYFDSVIGQPSNPQSHIVFAPRGGGKSAQRRMIEMASEDASFLCVLHDTFPISGTATVQGATLDMHLRAIARKLLVAILVHLDEEPSGAKLLNTDLRATLVLEATFQLGPLSAEEFHREVQSLKSLGRRASEWLKAHSGPIRPIINAIFKKADLEPPDFDAADEGVPTAPTESWNYRVGRLVEAALQLGYDSVYILIDKVDELPETSSDPAMAFALVSPLITNLPVLEMGGVGFKVFLWDRSQDMYLENGGRPDRIKDFTLGWTPTSLSVMMDRRLAAHSDGRMRSLNQLMSDEAKLDFHLLAATVAHGSPRDMVRLVKEVRDEHLNRPDSTGKFTRTDVFKGIDSFSSRIAEERSRRYMPDLLKVNAYRFTQGRLANDLLKIKKQSVQAKVADWRKTGLVEKIAELQDARNRPQHLYGVTDLRLAVAMRQDLDSEMILGQFALLCPSCASLNIADETEVVCGKCQTEFTLADANTLLEECEAAEQ